MKNRKHKHIFCLLFLTSAIILMNTTPSWSAISGKEVIERMREKFNLFETFQAQFRQTFDWTMTGETQSLDGTLIAAKGDRYRIETSDQIVVTDGKTLWNYSKLENQVTIDVLGNSPQTLFMSELIKNYTDNYTAKLIGEEKVNESECYIVELTAKNEEFFENVRVWVEKKNWLISRIQQTDINKNVHLYDIWNVQLNQELPSNTFIFDIPSDVDVVDLR